MVERRMELDRRYHRKEKMRQAEAESPTPRARPATKSSPRSTPSARCGPNRRRPERPTSLSRVLPEPRVRLRHAARGCGSPPPAPSARPAPGSSPCGDRCTCPPRSPVSGRGVIVSPSSRSSTSGPELAQFGRERGDAVGLLVADVGDVADASSARRRSRRPPPSVITVSLMSFMSTSTPRSGPPWTVMPGVALLDAAAHLLRARRRTARRLAATVPVQPGDGDAPAGDRGRGPEVARGGGVGLDGVVDRGRLVAAAADIANDRSASVDRDATPHCRIIAIVISTYGSDTSGAVDLEWSSFAVRTARPSSAR